MAKDNFDWAGGHYFHLTLRIRAQINVLLTSVKKTVDLSEERTEKGKQNSVTRAVEAENAELSNEISVDIKVRRSSKSKPVVANTLMEDKLVKKLVSSAKDALESDRNRPKKSSDKPAISIFSKNEIAVVNGEAKSW